MDLTNSLGECLSNSVHPVFSTRGVNLAVNLDDVSRELRILLAWPGAHEVYVL